MSTRAEWSVLVQQAVKLAADEMAAVLGARVRVEYDESAAVMVPRFVVPARLEDYFTERDRQRVLKQGLNFAREEALTVVHRLWKEHRNAAPNLWSFQTWHASRIAAAGGTEALSSHAFAEHMRLRRG